MDPTRTLKGKPVLIDKLLPELGGEVVKLVGNDMERAKRDAEERATRRKARRDRRPPEPKR